MKNILVIFVLVICDTACKEQTPKDIKEDSVVNTTIKTDKEKADSVLEYYQRKMESVGDSVPEMPE